MNEIVYIYALVDPDTDLIRYIGQTNKPSARLSEHITYFLSDSKKDKWITELRQAGKEPSMKILCESHVDFADQVENALIAAYMMAIPDLLNTRMKATGGISVRRKNKAPKIEPNKKRPVLTPQGVQWVD